MRARYMCTSVLGAVVLFASALPIIADDVWTRSDNSVTPNRLIIGYNSMADDDTRDSLRSSSAVRSTRMLSRSGDIELIEVRDGLPLKLIAQAIQAEPFVAFVEPDFRVSISNLEINDPDFDSLYAISITKASQAWNFLSNAATSLQETVVCVVDTG